MEHVVTPSGAPLIGLRWALKRSFLDYIARAPGGRGVLSDGAGATADREILFKHDARQISSPLQEGVFHAFRGAVTFSGHAGMLFVRISSPWIIIREKQGQLTTLDPFQRRGGTRLRLAVFDVDAHAISGDFECWTAVDVRLAPEACALFNDVYPAGEPLEPLTIIVPSAG